MQIAIGGFFHESNTFCQTPTNLESFQQGALYFGENIVGHWKGTESEISGFWDGAKQFKFEPVPTVGAWAWPSGTVTDEAFEKISNEIVSRIKRSRLAGKLDGVLLALHGAMVTESLSDPEGELLTRVRQLVGRDLPIVITLDFHANISELMVKMSHAIVVYDTYPHIDYRARGFEAAEIIVKVINGEVKPKMALCKPPLMPIPQRQWTSEGGGRKSRAKGERRRAKKRKGGGRKAEGGETSSTYLPMAKVMKLVHQIEKDKRIISASAAAGFAYADVPDAGFGAIVISDGDDELARQKAEEIANLAWRLRKQFTVELPTADEAVNEAIAYQRKKRKNGGPVILADVGDNVGGGTPGDGTLILKSLIKQQAEGAVVVIADDESVEAAIRAGVRNRLKLKVGGKTDELHGEPVEIEGYVKLISDGIFVNKGQMRDGIREDQGKTAVVEGDGITIILTERKLPTWNLQQLRAVGVDPTDQKIIVAKSAVAFRAAFEPIASRIIEVDTPGLTGTNLKAFDYKRVRRPIFPLDNI